MHCIIYFSRYLGTLDQIDSDLKQICESAKTNNSALNVNGVLFFQDGYFIQAIEGEEKDLRFLMNKISCDRRHTEIKYIMDQSIPQRSFNEWNMDSFNLDSGTLEFKDKLTEYRVMFKKMITDLDAEVFIDALKEFLNDPELRNIYSQ